MLNSCGSCPTAGVLPAVLIAGRPTGWITVCGVLSAFCPGQRCRIADRGFSGCVGRKACERLARWLHRFLLDVTPAGESNSERGQVVEPFTVIDVTLRTEFFEASAIAS
jgi:hypothetical protein